MAELKLEDLSPDLLKKIASLIEKDQRSKTIPKKRRGRPSKLKNEEREWLISFLGLENEKEEDLGVLLNNHRGRPSRILKQHSKKWDNPVYERDLFRKELSFRFGVACIFDDSKNQRFIAELITIGLSSYSSSYDFPYEDKNKHTVLTKAKKLVDEVDLDKKADNNPFNGVREYLAIAKKFKKTSAEQVPNRVSFALALGFLQKGYTEKNENELQDYDYVGISLKNIEMPPDQASFDFQEFCDSCVENFVRGIKQTEFVGKTTLVTKSAKLAYSMDCYRRKLKLKHYPVEIDKMFETSVEVISRKYKDKMPKKKNHQPLILPDIELILDMAANLNSMGMYYRLLLQLSTALRVKDVEKVNERHLMSTGQLCYNKIAPEETEYLVAKMEDKVDPSELVNPTTSLVTRIILKNFSHSVEPLDIEKFWEPNGYVRQQLSMGKSAYERSLRTTAATYLVWACDSQSFKRITYLDVQNRMAHATGAMLTEVYAKNRPHDYDDKTVDEYLDTPQLELDGKDLSQRENVWDLWLLNNLIEKVGIEKIKPLLRTEVESKEVFKPRRKSL